MFCPDTGTKFREPYQLNHTIPRLSMVLETAVYILKETTNAKSELVLMEWTVVCVYALCFTIWDLSTHLSLPCMVLLLAV